jgi:hypothetical protein
MDTRSKILTLDAARRTAHVRALCALSPTGAAADESCAALRLPRGMVTPVTGYFDASPAAHECVLRQTELAWTHEAKS